MRLTLPPIEITSETGFGSTVDIFKRRSFGEQLTNLIIQTNENLVFALDSNWGQGKSTFIKMWQTYNNCELTEPLRTIYFDAFENDYQKDAFLALASEVYEVLDDDEDAKLEFRAKASRVFRAFGRGLLKAGIRAGSAGLVDGTSLEAAEEELSNAISGNIDSIIADKLDNSKEDKNALKEFREFLEHIVKEKTSNKKLVFIIDELDRCRPDFALEIIEKIKHLFSVPGLTFVLVMNRTQLEESVKCRYGAGIEAQTYLQKFINIWLRLPSKRGQEYNLSDRGQFLDYAIKQMGSVLLSNNENTKNTFLKLVDVNETSFREIERMLTHMSIIQNVDKNITTYSWVYQVAISVLCFAKVHCPQICENLVSRSIDYDGVNKNLRVDFDNKDHYLREVAYFVKGILGSEEEREELIANKLLPTDRWGSFDDDVLISINDTLNNFIAN